MNNLDNSGQIKKVVSEVAELALKNNITIIPESDIKFYLDNNKEIVIIGEGSFGKVYRGLYGSVHIAIKKVKLVPQCSSQEFINEVLMCTRIKHKFIPKFYGIWIHNYDLHLIFDYINGIDLKTRMSSQKLSYKESLIIAIKLSDILDDLHKQNIIHRDLKPENIMLLDDNVYIIDFGVTKIAMHTETHTKLARGTVPYFAPENCILRKEDLYNDEESNNDNKIEPGDIKTVGENNENIENENNSNELVISTKYDVWSLACIISFMVTNRKPWSLKNGEDLDDFKIIVKLNKKKEFPIPKGVPEDLIKILKNCFCYIPGDRLSASEVKAKLNELVVNIKE